MTRTERSAQPRPTVVQHLDGAGEGRTTTTHNSTHHLYLTDDIVDIPVIPLEWLDTLSDVSRDNDYYKRNVEDIARRNPT